MKGKFLNTKNVVIGLVSLVLIGASATGVTVFLKNRGEAAAAQEENQVQNLPTTGNDNQVNQGQNNSGNVIENPTNPETPVTPVNPTTPGTTSTEQNQTTTGNTERPSRGDLDIEETEIERTNTTISEASTLGWTTIALSSITTDNMGLFKPELSISKTATEVIKNSDSEVAIQSENILPSVKAGDEIIYTIRIENNGNYVAKDISIKDMLPVVLGTRVSPDSDEVTFENQPVIPANTEIAKLDLEAKKAAILKVKYTVTQEDIDNLENTSIANIATVTLPGEDPIEDGDNSIEKEQKEDYKIYKTSILNKKGENKDEKAEVGDTITYTITVENTGTVTLEDLNVIDEMIELNEKITLKPGDKKVFEKDYEITASDIAKALDNDSKIKNTAVVEYKDNEDKPGKNEEDVKTSYNLTINYVYENGETASKTYTNTLNYLASYNVTSPEITGYKTETTVVEGEMPAHDVTVTVVYVKDATQTNKLTYKVNHIIVNGNEKTTVETNSFDENVYVLDEQKITVQNGSLTIKDASKIIGYKLDTESSSTVKEGDKVADKAEINFYYVKDATQTNKLTYTVNHIIVNGNEKTTVETNSFDENVYVLDEQKITVKNGSLTIKDASKIIGYKLDAESSSTVKEGDKVADKTEINFYYVKDSFSYSVEYYYDGVKDDNKKETDTAEYDSIITTYEDKVITGYVLEKVTPVDNNKNVSLRITENADNNVIRVYYVKDNFDYTVEYYKDTISENNKLGETGKISKPYGTVLTEEIVSQDLSDTNWINAKKPTGYKNGEVQGYITIGIENNVIKVLYKIRTDLKYTVKYYYNNEYKSDYSGTATFESKITADDIKDRSIDENSVQWNLLEIKPSEITIGLDESKNVIEVYYALPDIAVTKSIWQNGNDVTDKTIEAGSTVTYKLMAENTGYDKGTVTIKDTQIPEGTVKAEDVETVNKLKANGIDLEVPANSSATIEFTITLTGKIGTSISNTAEVDGKPTNTVNNNVEKTVQFKKQSETIKGTNVVIVLDTSGSMGQKNKLSSAKKETIKLIDKVIPTDGTNTGNSTVSVVEFGGRGFIGYPFAKQVGKTATNLNESKSLKSSVNNLDANGTTPYDLALTEANGVLTKLSNNNKNVIIFLSDGDPDNGNYNDIATAIKNSGTTIYTIGFDTTPKADGILAGIATPNTKDHKYNYTAGVNDLSAVFDAISRDVSEDVLPSKTSKNGKVELTGIGTVDSTHPITVAVNGNEIKITTLADARISYENGKYLLDLTGFNPTDSISIKYFQD